MGIKKLITNYKTLGHKEFMRRFKQGVETSSPLDQTKAQLVFTRMTLIGIALGFMVSVYNGKSLWWLAIILGAAFGNTYIQFIATKQKMKQLQQVQDLINSATEGPVQN